MVLYVRFQRGLMCLRGHPECEYLTAGMDLNMPTVPVSPRFQRIPDCRFRLDGFIGSYVHNVTEHWVKVIPASNPGMLENLRDRDRRPLRGHWCHEGEYPGKFLTGAVEMFRLTRDPQLEQVLREFVRTVIRYQADDGYLGIWP